MADQSINNTTPAQDVQDIVDEAINQTPSDDSEVADSNKLAENLTAL
jgi:hypothetical protein